MYVKIFSGILDSSIMDQDVATRWAWIAALCLADKTGRFTCTMEAFARRSNLPTETARAALGALTAPDPSSTTLAEDGRRLILEAPNSWWIVNYEHYRRIASEEQRLEQVRARVAKHAAKKRTNAPLTHANAGLTHANAGLTPAYTEAEAEAEAKAELLPQGETPCSSPAVAVDVPKVPNCPQQEILDLYHRILPELPRMRTWGPDRQATLRARWKEDPERQSLTKWEEFFTWVRKSDFLMGRAQVERGKVPFVATLDWMMKPRNFAKILDGNYHGKASTLSKWEWQAKQALSDTDSTDETMAATLKALFPNAHKGDAQ